MIKKYLNNLLNVKEKVNFFLKGKNKTYINNKDFVPSAQGVLEGNDNNYTRVQSKDFAKQRTGNS